MKNLFSQTASGLTSTTALSTLNSGRGVRSVGGTKPDFRMTFKSGAHLDVTIPSDATMNDVLSAINTGSAGKATASINANGNGLNIVDNTTGTGTLGITTLNGSSAATDLGVNGSWTTGTASGSIIFPNKSQQTGGGFGYMIERELNLLVDPVDGVITRQNQSIDDRNKQYDDRMSQIDSLVASKRARLEKQFANMESVLAGLQSQQSALSGLGSTAA